MEILISVVVVGVSIFLVWMGRDMKRIEIELKGAALYDALQTYPDLRDKIIAANIKFIKRHYPRVLEDGEVLN